eukprot:TRINITY_DN5144_c0_g1_i1.p1 TRINITY_DN5144_c0_g1~~TRINITY_DN5144_c0_g1_i1.p1  ORF type:complete len:279 (+),score=80.87 TRINITY_DN5144_c0_g1_i1:45-881(+)
MDTSKDQEQDEEMLQIHETAAHADEESLHSESSVSVDDDEEEVEDDDEEEEEEEEEGEEDQDGGVADGAFDSRETFKHYLETCLGAGIGSDEEDQQEEDGMSQYQQRRGEQNKDDQSPLHDRAGDDAKSPIRSLRMPGPLVFEKPRIQELGAPSNAPPSAKFSTFRPPASDLMNRLQAFLPQIAQANKAIEDELKQNPQAAQKYDIEAVSGQQKVIQMNLALGIYDVQSPKANGTHVLETEEAEQTITQLKMPFGSKAQEPSSPSKKPLIEELHTNDK